MSSYSQPTLTTSQISEIIDYVNAYRSKNQAPPMTWDSSIAAFSQQWSYYLIANNLFKHSNTPLYGENLAMLQGYGVDPVALIKKSIDMWYDEIKLYDFNNPGFSDATGHFTCLVWKSSTSFGMGLTIDMSSNKVDITMNTSPPGNYIGEFQQNVLPTVGQPPIVPPRPPTPPIVTPRPPTPPIVPQPVAITLKQFILQSLHNLAYIVNSNQPKYLIVNAVNQIIYKINTSNQTQDINSIINGLYNIIYAVQRRQRNAIISNLIINLLNYVQINYAETT